MEANRAMVEKHGIMRKNSEVILAMIEPFYLISSPFYILRFASSSVRRAYVTPHHNGIGHDLKSGLLGFLDVDKMDHWCGDSLCPTSCLSSPVQKSLYSKSPISWPVLLARNLLGLPVDHIHWSQPARIYL
jgi:hypothetical protein